MYLNFCMNIILTLPLSLTQQYVRVSSDTSSNVLYKMMTQQWGLEVPNLVISVTGGAKDFRMKMRLKNIFRRGLVKAAQTTGDFIVAFVCIPVI